MDERSYPAPPAEAGLVLFQEWLGATYARSTGLDATVDPGPPLSAVIRVGRRWRLAVLVVDTISPEAGGPFAFAQAAVEQRLDAEELTVVLWVPRGATLARDEPGLSELVMAVREAKELDDGRLELRRAVTIHLRRTSTDGSVMTALGGIAPHWARFTGQVPGSFQLNSNALSRLPASEESRTALFDRILSEARQPTIDDSHEIPAIDAWTVNRLRTGRAYALGSPQPDSDETSSNLRRAVRQQLRAGGAIRGQQADAYALVVLGLATYASEEKLSWVVRGLDPALYAGFDMVAVVADGLVKPLIQPARNVLPWDAPLTKP